MFTSHEQNAEQNCNIKSANKLFESVAKFKYSGKTQTHHNCIGEIQEQTEIYKWLLPFGPESFVSQCLSKNIILKYTGCPRRKGPNFGRVFLRSNYNDITQNTYIQSSMVTEISAREV